MPTTDSEAVDKLRGGGEGSTRLVEPLLREFAPGALVVVARRYRDFAAAEDAVQEACLAAACQWPRDGTPADPRAWLIRVAFRRLADRARSELARRRREGEFAFEATLLQEPAPAESASPEGDTLDLLFMCCHPSLTLASAVALSLRAAGGLTTAEIARAFLVPEATMAQRIGRAKQAIRESDIAFERPAEDERRQRLGAVLRVLYLIFSEGYAASSGPTLKRDDLASEAIRMTRMVVESRPYEPEADGLLALMLLTDARRLARTDANGAFVPLDQQDRSLWNTELIEEGAQLLSRALNQGSVGPYQVQAAVAALHDEADSTDHTDWPQIRMLYDLLMRMSDNPMAALSRAVATAMIHGAAEGLEELASLEPDPRLADHHRFHAVRAHLLELDGRRSEAIAAYRAAAIRTANQPERDHLFMKAARLAAEGGSREVAGIAPLQATRRRK